MSKYPFGKAEDAKRNRRSNVLLFDDSQNSIYTAAARVYNKQKEGERMTNETLNVIKSRRSTRAYKTDPVPEKLLDAVLEAGTFAPSGMNKQSPTIVAVTGDKYRREISALNAAVMGVASDPYYGAPVVVLVLADSNAGTWVEDGSCVLENMMLAAESLGLATVWVHREREIFDSERGKQLLREWGLPETLRGVGSIALGYAATPAKPAAPRKDGYIVKV